mmetsp:Transcript_22503/g.47389  ORF Transcript_22503/g.47389 Transcript_22503/m.47389 type:complete len:406 (-) Transcript_22503:243-1460(-)
MAVNGKSIDDKYWSLRPCIEMWSTYRWPRVFVKRRELMLWRQALTAIAPYRRLNDRLGSWAAATHKKWEWWYDSIENTLYRNTGGGWDRYGSAQLINPAFQSHHFAKCAQNVVPPPDLEIAQVQQVTDETYRKMHTAPPFKAPSVHTDDFRTILNHWGGSWMWDHTTIVGHYSWVAEAAAANTLHVATDGSYMRHLAPDTYATAFILECTEGRGQYIGSFASSGSSSNAYRGELLGLLAISLVLRSVNTIYPELHCSVPVYCDCEGAIKRIRSIPTYLIPTNAKHAKILKLFLSYQGPSTITPEKHHIKAHQDDLTNFERLSWLAQLNCECDYNAKSHLLANLENPRDRLLPNELVAITIQGSNLTADTGTIRFHIGKQLARQFFTAKNILDPRQFDKVDWHHVS